MDGVFYRKILDSLAFWIFLKDEQGRFLYGNRVFLEAAGVNTLEQLVGLKDHELARGISDNELAYFLSNDQVVRKGKVSKTPLEFTCSKNGRRVALATTKVPFEFVANGLKKNYVLGVASELSDEDYSSVLSGKRLSEAGIGMYLTDTEGKIAVINDLAAGLLGEERRESLVHKKISDFCSSDFWNDNLENEKVLRYGKKYRNQIRFLECDSSSRALSIVESSKFPIRDSKNKRVGMIGFLRDVSSERKASQAAAQKVFFRATVCNFSNKIHSMRNGFEALKAAVVSEDYDGINKHLGVLDSLISESACLVKGVEGVGLEGDGDSAKIMELSKLTLSAIRSLKLNKDQRVQISRDSHAVGIVNVSLARRVIKEIVGEYLNAGHFNSTSGNISMKDVFISVTSDLEEKDLPKSAVASDVKFVRLSFIGNIDSFYGAVRKTVSSGKTIRSRGPQSLSGGLIETVEKAMSAMNGFSKFKFDVLGKACSELYFPTVSTDSKFERDESKFECPNTKRDHLKTDDLREVLLEEYV